MDDPKLQLEPGFEIDLTGGHKTIVLEIDRDLDEANWCSNGRYAMRKERGKTILMHRVIAERMGLNMAMKIKHKDGNTLNNRRTNLLEGGPVPRRRPQKGGRKHD